MGKSRIKAVVPATTGDLTGDQEKVGIIPASIEVPDTGLRFNTLLREAGFELDEVLLLRHSDPNSAKGYSPFELWRDKPEDFRTYQSVQSVKARSKFAKPYWAAFVVNSFGDCIFAGIWRASYSHQITEAQPKPQSPGEVDPPNSLDKYNTELCDGLRGLIGRLVIDWGKGKERAWAQHAVNQNKGVIEISRQEVDPPFPGLLQFIEPLSRIGGLPRTWVAILKEAKGVYLLTCPKTKEQYVGSASGQEGFWGRLSQYARDGHGGNVKLKSKEPSDYQVVILEVAGSQASNNDIHAKEGRWQLKLQSHKMGLNCNVAKNSVNS